MSRECQNPRCILLRYFALATYLAGFCQAAPEYFAVCDAGSTGTRLYIFELDIEASTAKSVFVKKTKPGLSSYADNPTAAVPPLLKLFGEGAEQVPQDLRSKTSLAIFGTAGMRLLALEKQNAIWEAVKSGLVRDSAFPFAPGRLQARTVSGNEEGLWAVLTANFLTGRMSHDILSLGKGAPLGLMDLGGSSTQIAIPVAIAAQKGVQFDIGAIVHSYLGFGMTHIREQVRKKTTGGKDAVCYMKGASVEDELVGTGQAPECRTLIREMMAEQSRMCQASEVAEKPCLGDLAQVPEAADSIVKGKVDFFAVAGLTYVVDFVRWWLERHPTAAVTADSFLKAYPRPSLDELIVAVDAMCAGEYAFVAQSLGDKKLAHPYTGADNAPFRCFQANYILVLLGEMYGFAKDGRSVTFALDVDGEDLEWPLGALLHQRSRPSPNVEL